MDNIQNQICELENELIELRRDFHMFPELGFQEFETAKKIETYLKNIGLKPERVAKTNENHQFPRLLRWQ